MKKDEAQMVELLGEEDKHPAYGSIGVSRTTSSRGHSLYGCSIKHTSTIKLRIARATKRRKHYADSHYAEQRIVEVEMSAVQFAEMITSMNMGEGVPCTIRWVQGEGSIPEPDFESKRETFVNEFRGHTDKVGKRFDALIAEAEELAKKATVGKGERAEFAKKLRLLKQAVQSDTPFIADQFQEQIDKTVSEAKGEVDAFISNVVRETGLESIRSGNITLGLEGPKEG